MWTSGGGDTWEVGLPHTHTHAQTRQNTIGYIDVAKHHYSRLIARKTEAIAELQITVLEVISDASLTDKQRKALKGTYEELMKDAEVEAKEVKRDRDETSQAKLSCERPAKRQKLDNQRYVNDHSCIESHYTAYHYTEDRDGTTLLKDLGNSVGSRDKTGEVAPTKRRNRRHRDRTRRFGSFNKRNKSLCESKDLHDNVVNLSSYQPSKKELDILSKGLSFIPDNALAISWEVGPTCGGMDLRKCGSNSIDQVFLILSSL